MFLSIFCSIELEEFAVSSAVRSDSLERKILPLFMVITVDNGLDGSGAWKDKRCPSKGVKEVQCSYQFHDATSLLPTIPVSSL